MNTEHAYGSLGMSRLPTEAEIEAAMRRARRERAEMAHSLARQVYAWIVGPTRKRHARAATGVLRPAA